MSETSYEGYYEITDQTGGSGDADTNFECSCGVLVWDVASHIKFHQSLGHVVTDKR